MIKRKHWELFSKAVLIVLVVLLASEPVLVAAMPNEVNERQEAIDSFTASGDVYLSSVTAALTANTTLVGALAAIQATPIDQLSENAVLQTRATALDAAESSAVALGSIDDVAASVESIGGNLPAAFDAYQRAGEGLPQQTRTDLITEAGLSSTDVDAVSAGMDDLLLTRQDMALNGMPAATASQLAQTGFSQEEINRIAVVAGNRGLANTSLTTSLAQFRSSQDEWANVRTQMLMINVQLMGYQIGARQAAGINARAVTETELQEIAEDELRLLVHVAHLQELWGTDPDLNEGEGDWWFIEHYAGRAAERLDALVIESQNRALIADLFVLQEMRLLALSARNGDAAYVKQELDGLGKTLEYLVGDQTFIARQRDEMQGITYAVARLASLPSLRERVKWNIQESDRNHTIRHARVRLDALGVQNLSVLFGQIQEQNESNNRKSIVFMSGFSQIDQATRAILQEIMSIATEIGSMQLVDLIWAILSGDTDNPLLVATNMLLGMIPVISVITDLFALVVADGTFMRAILLFALFCDIGEALALIPGLQAAAVAYIGGAVGSVVKILFTNSDSIFKGILNGLRLTNAFNVIVGLVKVVSNYVSAAIHSLNEAIQVLQSILTGGLKLWDNFLFLVRRAGADLLIRWGVTDSTLLVGRVLRFLDVGVNLSDEAFAALKSVTDDLVASGVDLSDEAAAGLGKMAKSMEPDQFRRLVNALGNTCNVGLINTSPKRARISIFRASSCVLPATIFTSYKRFDAETLTALGRMADNVELNDFTALLSKFAADPDNLDRAQFIFKVLGDPAIKADAIRIATKQGPDAAEAFALWDISLLKKDSSVVLAARASKDVQVLRDVDALIALRPIDFNNLASKPAAKALVERIAANSMQNSGDFIMLGKWIDGIDGGYAGAARAADAQYFFPHSDMYNRLIAFPDRNAAFWAIDSESIRAGVDSGLDFKFTLRDIPAAEMVKDKALLDELAAIGRPDESTFLSIVNRVYGASATPPVRIQELHILIQNNYEVTIDSLGQYVLKP